jgi:hypothetical protein
MTKIYTKNTWVDEVLATTPTKYQVKNDAGTEVYAGAEISLATAVSVAGSPVNATRMNNIDDGLDALDTKVSDMEIHGATNKATIADDDEFGIADSAATYGFKHVLFSLIKSTLKTYNDTLYTPVNTTTPNDGWIAGTGTWSYSSADAPTFVMSINANITGLIGIGDKIKLTQTSAKYFIVTAVGSWSGSATLVTVYGGTNYTLANAAITTPFYSHEKTPFGFPASPVKWTVTLSDANSNLQTSPTVSTYYNPGSLNIVAPIGVWNISISYLLQCTATVTGSYRADLSTSTSSSTNPEFGFSETMVVAATNRRQVYMKELLTLTSKTTFYLICLVGQASQTNVGFLGTANPTTIKLVCAYL